MSASTSSSKYLNIWPKVILLGDSLTQHSFDEEGGFGTLLASLLKRKADVLNRGFSGYSTETLKYVLPKMFDPQFLKDVACLTWENVGDTHKFNPAVPVDRYKKNLVHIIEFLEENGLTKEKIVMITPPTIQTDKWAEFVAKELEFPITKTPEATRRYADAMIAVGTELGIKVLDSFELTSREEHLNRAFIDGLHFSKYGAQLIYELIKEDVENRVIAYRQSDEENFPTYDWIDFNNLDETFG